MSDQPATGPFPGQSPAGSPPAGPGAGFAARAPLDVLAPGQALAGRTEDAFEAGLGGLPDDELVGFLCASRRLASWAAGLELAAAAELDGRRRATAARPGWSGVSEHVSEELAAALTLTGRSADGLLGLARGVARLPGVGTALRAGRIDRDRAAVFAAELAVLGDVAAAAVAAVFCGVAGSMTTGQLRAALRAMVLAVDPEASRRRAERGRAGARMEHWTEGSGNAGLAGRELPTAEVIAADERVSAIARALKDAGAPGGLDQLRAQVFLALLAGRDPEDLLPGPPPGGAGPGGADPGGSGPGSSGPGGPRACDPRACDPGQPGSPGSGGLAGLSGSVHLTMPLSTWLGLGDAPGEVAGHGPLDADACRDLTARLAAGPGARWCLTLTGPDGRAAAHACARAGPPGPGARRAAWLAGLRLTWLEDGACSHARRYPGYQPPNLLRHLVKVRQRTCSFPGCRRPATRCDLDHTIPWDQGGPTCECNLAPLCRRHHQAKQAPGWKLTQTQPGTLTWTLPHGRSYAVTPDPYPA